MKKAASCISSEHIHMLTLIQIEATISRDVYVAVKLLVKGSQTPASIPLAARVAYIVCIIMLFIEPTSDDHHQNSGALSKKITLLPSGTPWTLDLSLSEQSTRMTALKYLGMWDSYQRYSKCSHAATGSFFLHILRLDNEQYGISTTITSTSALSADDIAQDEVDNFIIEQTTEDSLL